MSATNFFHCCANCGSAEDVSAGTTRCPGCGAPITPDEMDINAFTDLQEDLRNAYRAAEKHTQRALLLRVLKWLGDGPTALQLNETGIEEWLPKSDYDTLFQRYADVCADLALARGPTNYTDEWLEKVVDLIRAFAGNQADDIPDDLWACLRNRPANSTPAPVALGGEPPCNPHPDAPHGYNRNASHNAGRYVCDCEGWAALGGEKGEASGPEIYIARVAMLREHAKQAKTVTEEDVLDAASMDADELRRRYLVQKDWHRLFAKCLDGLPFAQHGINGGTCPDGCWFPRDIRAIVERLLVDPAGKARMLTRDEFDAIWMPWAPFTEFATAIQRKFCEVNGITLEGGNRSRG